VTASISTIDQTSDRARKRISTCLRVLGCVLITAPIFYLLRQHLVEMDGAQIASALRAISLQSIAAAGFFTMISLMAVARYDVLAIRQLGLKVPEKTAVRGGFVAVSIGQTLGFGLIVGAIARWRFYRGHGVGATEAGLISGIVTIGFLNGFVIILSLSALIVPDGLVTLTGFSAGAIQGIASLALLIASGVLVASILQPRIHIGARTVSMPKLRVLRAQIVLAALDTIPAAIALWVLIPSDVAPSLFLVIPVYLSALGLGLVSNTPGGLGVLELTCLMALPVLPPEQLIAALIAYRAIYFGVPAVIAAAMLVAKEMQRGSSKETAPVQHSASGDLQGPIATSVRAEANLAYLDDKSFIFSECCGGFLMYAISGNSMIALSDPVGPDHLWDELHAQFTRAANQQMLTPSFYKTGPEFAQFLKSKGQFSAQIASDAVVDVQAYATSGSSKRELRRKLKSACDLEVIHHEPGQAPMAIYRQISAAWAASKGGERGFSMGYFAPDFINRFASIEARLNTKTIGFLTIWASGDGREYGLDVMRLSDDAPDGSMHALVNAGIEWAKENGAARFSLCAVPLMISEEPSNWAEQALTYVYAKKPKWHGSTGLYRFKNAFRPSWEPRYGSASSVASAAIAAYDVSKLINAPKTGGTSHEDAVEPQVFQPVAA